MKVAVRFCQHSKMLGQPASSQTVLRDIFLISDFKLQVVGAGLEADLQPRGASGG